MLQCFLANVRISGILRPSRWGILMIFKSLDAMYFISWKKSLMIYYYRECHECNLNFSDQLKVNTHLQRLLVLDQLQPLMFILMSSRCCGECRTSLTPFDNYYMQSCLFILLLFSIRINSLVIWLAMSDLTWWKMLELFKSLICIPMIEI